MYYSQEAVKLCVFLAGAKVDIIIVTVIMIFLGFKMTAKVNDFILMTKLLKSLLMSLKT